MATRLSKSTREKQRKKGIIGRKRVSLKEAQKRDRKRRGKTSSGKTAAKKNAQLLQIHGSPEAKARNEALAEATGQSRTSQGGLQQANLNAQLLQIHGSPEALARNAELPSAISNGSTPLDNPTAPTIANAAALQQAGNGIPGTSGTISEATPEQSAAMSTMGQFQQAMMQAFMGEQVSGTGGVADAGLLAGTLASVIPIGRGIQGGVKAGAAFRSLFAAGANNVETLPQIGTTSNNVFKFSTKTRKILHDAVKKIPWKTATALYLATQWIDAKAFAGFNTAESGDVLSYPLSKAAEIAEETGDWTLFDGLVEGVREVQQPDNRSLLNKLLPWTESIEGTDAKIRNQQIAADVWEEYGRLKKESSSQEEEGFGTSAAFWSAYQERKAADEREIAELIAENRLRYLEAEQAAKEENRLADARYWAAQNAASIKKEAELLEMRRKYWEDVRKLQLNSAPSKLNFGLI